VPEASYDVVVFENRFPSYSPVSGHGPTGREGDIIQTRPALGRCEVVCFTSNHDSTFADLTPERTRTVIDAWADRTGGNLFTDILAREAADGSRVVASTELFTAFVPFAARWPVEVHIYPNRFVHNRVDMTDAELDGFAQIYLDVLTRFDRMYPTALPYISALHQYANSNEQYEGYFHVELMSVRRSATKLKFLAGSESAMDAFISDVTPESVAQRLRELA
jgi:galactose-1-phosphate uridylyltransferase